MKIIASSTVPNESVFLHAGYISSMPRPFTLSHFVDVNKPENGVQPLSLNVSKSLQLVGDKSESTTKAAIAPPPPLKSPTSDNSLAVMALGVALFFCCVGLLHYLRRYSQRLAFALLMSLLFLSYLGMNAYSERRREDTEVISYNAHPVSSGSSSYKDPYSATLVIMHGLLANGVINTNEVITSLDQIHKKVAFPTTKLTAGMKYALDHYSCDGWGNPISFRTINEDSYELSSLGADGKPNTKDDIVIRFKRANDENWDSLRWGWFAQKEGEILSVYFHRWPGELFEYLNKELAQQKSGSTLFDVWTSDRERTDSMERIKTSSQWKLATTMKEGELYLWVSAWKMSRLL